MFLSNYARKKVHTILINSVQVTKTPIYLTTLSIFELSRITIAIALSYLTVPCIVSGNNKQYRILLVTNTDAVLHFEHSLIAFPHLAAIMITDIPF